jgi:hypothetical protein
MCNPSNPVQLYWSILIRWLAIASWTVLTVLLHLQISPQTSLKAIALLRICEDRLADVSLDVLVTSAGKLCIYHEYFGFQILFIDVRYSNCSSWSN